MLKIDHSNWGQINGFVQSVRMCGRRVSGASYENVRFYVRKYRRRAMRTNSVCVKTSRQRFWAPLPIPVSTHLQHTATHCNILQHTPTRCNAQCWALPPLPVSTRMQLRKSLFKWHPYFLVLFCKRVFGTLQHSTVRDTHCYTLQRYSIVNGTHFHILQHTETHWNTMSCWTHCNTLQHTATHWSTGRVYTKDWRMQYHDWDLESNWIWASRPHYGER